MNARSKYAVWASMAAVAATVALFHFRYGGAQTGGNLGSLNNANITGTVLSNETAAVLLKTHQTEKCKSQTINNLDGPGTTSPRDWTQANIAIDQRFTVGSVQKWVANIGFNLGIYQDISWYENGTAVYGTLRVMTGGSSSLSFCAFVPDTIQILDQTPTDGTGKVVNVTFAQHNKPSAVMAKSSTMESRWVALIQQEGNSSEGEHTAVLQRLDATGWRVQSVH